LRPGRSEQASRAFEDTARFPVNRVSVNSRCLPGARTFSTSRDFFDPGSFGASFSLAVKRRKKFYGECSALFFRQRQGRLEKATGFGSHGQNASAFAAQLHVASPC
jgi:hypothetical protein